MGLAEELIAVKMRLQGATQYQAQMEKSATATAEFGAAAERAGAQAKTGAVGINTMQASAAKGMGALAGMKRAGEGMKSVGSKMTSAFTVPLAIIGGVGVKMALDFSDSMEQVSTQAGASQREVDQMSKAVLAFAGSGKSAAGPNELAAGLFRIESAGFRGKKAMDALIHSEELSTVGHADLEKTSKAVAAAMATQIEGTKDLDETVGLMNATVGIGSMRFEDLLSAMGTGMLDKAANLGLSLKEIGAALGTLTTVGMPAAASATRMGMAFNMMAAPTKKAEDAMKTLGLRGDTLALSLRKKGLIPTLEMLKGKLEGTFGTSAKGKVEMAKTISEMFGGGRTSAGIIGLMRHIDLLKTKQGELTGVTEKFHTALQRTNEQPITKLHKAWAQMQVVLIEIGVVLIPVVTGMAKFFVGVFKGFSKLPGPVKKVLIFLGLTLAVLGPILTLVGTMTLGIYGLATAFAALDVTAGIWIVAAIAIVAAWYMIITNFSTWGKYVVAFLLGPMALVALVIVSKWDWIKNAVSNAVGFIGKMLSKLPGLLLKVVKAWPRMLGRIVGFWVTLPIRIAAALVNLAPTIANAFVDTWNFLHSVPGRAFAALADLAPKLLTAGKKGISKLWDGLKAAWPSIKSWFASLPGKMWAAIKSGVSDLFNAGKEFASEFLKGFAESLPGPVKDLLGINDEISGELIIPSTVYPNVGGNPGAGKGGRKGQTGSKGHSGVGPVGRRNRPYMLTDSAGRATGKASQQGSKQPIIVKASFSVGRRQLGEATAEAVLDDEANG